MMNFTKYILYNNNLNYITNRIYIYIYIYTYINTNVNIFPPVTTISHSEYNKKVLDRRGKHTYTTKKERTRYFARATSLTGSIVSALHG